MSSHISYRNLTTTVEPMLCTNRKNIMMICKGFQIIVERKIEIFRNWIFFFLRDSGLVTKNTVKYEPKSSQTETNFTTKEKTSQQIVEKESKDTIMLNDSDRTITETELVPNICHLTFDILIFQKQKLRRKCWLNTLSILMKSRRHRKSGNMFWKI